MAMAKPILATRVGDIPAIVEDSGFLVEPSSPEQLAEKIQWIFEHLDPARKRGLNARERCVDRYSIDSMSEILAPILKLPKASSKVVAKSIWAKIDVNLESFF